MMTFTEIDLSKNEQLESQLLSRRCKQGVPLLEVAVGLIGQWSRARGVSGMCKIDLSRNEQLESQLLSRRCKQGVPLLEVAVGLIGQWSRARGVSGMCKNCLKGTRDFQFTSILSNENLRKINDNTYLDCCSTNVNEFDIPFQHCSIDIITHC